MTAASREPWISLPRGHLGQNSRARTAGNRAAGNRAAGKGKFRKDILDRTLGKDSRDSTLGIGKSPPTERRNTKSTKIERRTTECRNTEHTERLNVENYPT